MLALARGVGCGGWVGAGGRAGRGVGVKYTSRGTAYGSQKLPVKLLGAALCLTNSQSI